MNGDNILEIRHITKTYPGVVALGDVSFSVRRGEIHALCGENGAGKSTLIKILFGAEQPDGGEIVIDGKAAVLNSPEDGVRNGISVVNQELKLAEHLCIAENIFLGHLPEKRVLGKRFVDWKGIHREAAALLSRMKIGYDVRQTVGGLSVAKKQIVEIAKALSYKSRILIMDEPSAALTDKELDTLFDIIGLLRAEGVTIIYISHRLEEVFRIADRVTVLRDGRYIATTPVKETDRERLIAQMVGRELGNEYPKENHATLEPGIEVRALTTPALRSVSFQACKGEVLGIAGLVGAGRTELARAVFGADPVQSGEVRVGGRAVAIRSVSDAIGSRIALIPEDRKSQGVVLGMSIRENVTLVNIGSYIKSLLINRKKERASVRRHIDALRVKTPGMEVPVSSLSGGNQQKVVLAKWLDTNSDVVIFDEPTRGIDVGAKVEIYHIINELARAKKTILMISSEMPELIGMCDRVVVMHEGEIKGELRREELSQERIMELAIS